MSFWKRLFGVKQEVAMQSFLDYLQAIELLLKPSINPVKHHYKEAFFRNDFTFEVDKNYSKEQMQQLTWLENVTYVKRKQSHYVWKAPIRELRAIQMLDKPKFAEQYITPVVGKLQEAQFDFTNFESIVEYEETIKNIYEALQKSGSKHGADAVWDKSQQLLKRVSLDVQQELRQFELTETTEHLDQLMIEEKYINRHKNSRS